MGTQHTMHERKCSMCEMFTPYGAMQKNNEKRKNTLSFSSSVSSSRIARCKDRITPKCTTSPVGSSTTRTNYPSANKTADTRDGSGMDRRRICNAPKVFLPEGFSVRRCSNSSGMVRNHSAGGRSSLATGNFSPDAIENSRLDPPTAQRREVQTYS